MIYKVKRQQSKGYAAAATNLKNLLQTHSAFDEISVTTALCCQPASATTGAGPVSTVPAPRPSLRPSSCQPHPTPPQNISSSLEILQCSSSAMGLPEGSSSQHLVLEQHGSDRAWLLA